MWYRFGITRVSDFRGLSKTMPWTMAAFTISGLSLIGVPLTAGFVSKLQLTTAAWERGYGPLVGVILLSSILALIYIGRILRVAYFETPHKIDGVEVAKNEAPLMMLIPMWILATSSIAIGINADWIVEAANRAAELLIPTQMIGERL